MYFSQFLGNPDNLIIILYRFAVDLMTFFEGFLYLEFLAFHLASKKTVIQRCMFKVGKWTM